MGSKEKQYHGIAAIYLALVILLFPLTWVAAMGAAALLHELGHWLAVKCCGKRVSTFKIGMTGAIMETEPMEIWQELLCTLAGPLAGLLPLTVMQWMPRVAICGAVQSVFNLLPIYPLDGGRCLVCIARLLSIPEKYCRIFGYAVLCIISFLSIYASLMLPMGLAPVLAAAALWMKAKGKRPCKQGRHWI